MKLRILFTIIFIFKVFVCVFANKYNLPIETIGNTSYYCYKVKAKETIYSISNKFGITQEELTKYNPSIVDGLKKDYILFLPVNLIDNIVTTQSNSDYKNHFTHIVKKGETLYGISKTYGISQDTIIRENPFANEGIKTGQILIIPQPKEHYNSHEISDNISNTIYHTIQKGETLYRLSKNYNTSIENILKLNPNVTIDNFKVGVVIKILANSLKSETKDVYTTIFKPYITQKGDNLKKIAKSQNIDYNYIKIANPNISKIKEGMTIQIPFDTIQSIKMIVNEGNEDELKFNNSERIQEIYDSIHSIKYNKDINVALLLPFMLNEQTVSKQSQHYTEFYKGFLMAIKEVNYENNQNINIYTYDIKNNLETLDSILYLPEIKKMDLIFGPENIEQLNHISDFCQRNNIYCVNTFSLKTDKYNNNPYLIQINTPQDHLLFDVNDWLSENFNDYSIVFIHKTNTTYKELTKDIKSFFKTNGNEIIELEYNKVFTTNLLTEILQNNKKYLLVPTSGSNSVMSQVILSSKRLKDQKSNINFAVLGQPEWIIYLNDWKNNFHSVNTFIYSRFFADNSNYEITNFENKFVEWYGEKPTQGAPTFSYLGYDISRYFVENISHFNSESKTFKMEYRGLQSAFNFERVTSWSGLINKSIFIINFNPDNNTYTTIK